MLPLRLRLHIDSSISDILDDAEPDQCGVWLLLDKSEVIDIEGLWHNIVETNVTELGSLALRDCELRSQDCRLPWNSPIEILQDGQEITLHYISSNADIKKRRRHELETNDRVSGTPGSVPFTSSPALPVTEQTSDTWQLLRKRYRRKYVPDWAISKLPVTVRASEKGIPRSGIEGITWNASSSKAGWQARYKSARQFYSLTEFSHVDAMTLARRWILEQQRVQSGGPTASTGIGDRIGSTQVAYDREESAGNSCCESDSLVIKSEVRGVGLCKGSWKARWRDSSGRQRMRTFGPHPEDREAAEKFISEVRADIKGRREASKHVSLTARVENRLHVKCSAWSHVYDQAPRADGSPVASDHFGISDDHLPALGSSVIQVKEEDSKQMLASLLHAD